LKYRPGRIKHLMKMAFAKIYWLSLRGLLEPMFDIYFRWTRPPERQKTQPSVIK